MNRLYTILWGLVGITFVPVIGDVSVELAKRLGWRNSLVDLAISGLGWIGSLTNLAVYPYIVGGTIGLLAGALLEKHRKTKPRRQTNLEKLGYRCRNLAAQMRQSLGGIRGSIVDPTVHASLFSEYEILRSDLASVGIKRLPQLGRDKVDVQCLKSLIPILDGIAPYLVDNRIQQARQYIQ